ncbi:MULTISPECIES: AAA family ATPase [unclassified Adlercreutzia]|uniref:AAA family ATPase n=1 Tax=unclassified Adlercreutzia TaxID=2636013 RepID=UPI0013ECAA4A|nr:MULTISPECIES: AAA family ATPase [unclassified Adlercreutzia]
MASYEKLEDVIGKDLLSWVSYPTYELMKVCFVYPQYVLSGDELVPLDPGLFPSRGCICASINGKYDAGKIRGMYGEVVIARINKRDIGNKEEDHDDRYFAKLNPDYIGGEIELEAFEDHKLGRNLIQIVEVIDDADFAHPFKDALEAKSAEPPITDLIAVEQTEGTRLLRYGPFAYRFSGEGSIALSATDDYRQNIFAAETEIGDVVTLRCSTDLYGETKSFIKLSVFNALSRRASAAIDWMSDADLLEGLRNIMRKQAELTLSPAEISAAIKAIGESSSADAGFSLTEGRKERLRALLAKPDKALEYTEILAAALRTPEMSDRLMELATSEEHWPSVKELLVDRKEIAEQLEQEMAGYRAEAEEQRRQTEAAKKEAQAALADAQRIREEALGSAQEELGEIKREIAEGRGELETLAAAKQRLQEDAALLEEAAASVLAKYDGDARSLLENVLEGRLAGGALASAGTARGTARKTARSGLATPRMREDEEGLSPEQIVQNIVSSLDVGACREVASEDVANLMVCIMSGNITVLSGLPGTGKTSLAEAVAGALGLRQDGARRFTRINVEQGWTSHRDYIGYYNPLTGALQATDQAVMDDILLLDGECRAADGQALPPHLILLDEANLSTMENYWSPFIANSDDALAKPTALNMQGGESLLVPASVKWLATVNFDHTTEALSPRFLNRAWVVDTGATESVAPSFGEAMRRGSGFGEERAYSYGRLMAAFGPTGNRIEPSQRELLERVFSVCAEHRAPVSWRCQQAIARYVSTATPLMRALKTKGEPRVVDYAVAQRVLPSINGMGEVTRRLLEELKKASEKTLPKTCRLVTHMLDQGNDDGFYQFFC